ncbi:MAG: hypothetical protein HFG27_09025 [Provencibacterium sp.]|jgi:hypothetical protein|nr:hypothetical protein [Provencibacterium sp.]
MYVNRTPTLGLPQYEGSDKLQRVDMNAAYAVMDAAIAARPAADEQGKYPAARLADQAESAAALGGVSANGVLKGLSVPSTYTDFHEWADAQEYGGAFEIGPVMKTGVPFANSYYSGYLEVTPSNTKRVILTYRTGTAAQYGSTYVSTYSSGEWKPWVPFAMQYGFIENPPLSSGWSYSPAFANEKSYICRQGNIVSVLMSIKTSADYSAWTDVIALPAGYRPKARCAVRACIGNESACTLFFYASGSVQCSVPINANTAMQITFSYIGG